MSNAEDHALGLELQLIELVERQTRAHVQHRDGDAAAVQREIDELQRELAAVTESMTQPSGDGPVDFHGARPAEPPGPERGRVAL